MSLIVIPVRLGSKRLYGKALIKIGDKELILRVVDQCIKSIADRIVVITDSEEVFNVCKKLDITDNILDKTPVVCGSDRAARVLDKYDDNIILNVQCDEPFISPELLNLLIEDLRRDNSNYINTPFVEIDELEAKDPNIVKVVMDKQNFALYFSRALIPYYVDTVKKLYNKHIGVYGFHRDTLMAFSSMQRGYIEDKEHLEQLRALENNIPIKMLQWYNNIISINTLADVKKAEKYLKEVDING
jgi:3-deoxy-manno-octulosonate cytidylyltransferase (CMP-KDO synthetase)